MDADERRRHATDKAAEYLVMIEDPPLSRQEREEIVDWLRESPIHVAEMLRVAEVSGALEQFRHWSRIDGSVETDAGNVIFLQPNAKTTRIATRTWRAAAAVLVLAAVFAVAWFNFGSRTHTIETQLGERREVSLTDGSRVEVDPGTRLRVKFSAGQRDIFLDSGRALFKVAKDARRPFVVHSEGTFVRAVGTAFGVEREEGSLVVTVAEGKVTVGTLQAQTQVGESADTANLSQGAAPNASASLVLNAGEQIVVPRFGSARDVRHVDSGRALAWAEGRLIFDNESILSVIEQFNRYNRMQMHVDDPVLAKRLISGVFSASDPNSFVEFLRSAIQVHAVQEGMQDITLSLADPAR